MHSADEKVEKCPIVPEYKLTDMSILEEESHQHSTERHCQITHTHIMIIRQHDENHTIKTTLKVFTSNIF